jgi:dihydrofolate reductase
MVLVLRVEGPDGPFGPPVRPGDDRNAKVRRCDRAAMSADRAGSTAAFERSDDQVGAGAEDAVDPGRPTPHPHRPLGSQARDPRVGAHWAAAVVDRTVEDDPGAPFFNDTTKYVVSSTLTDPTWRNSTVIGGYDADRLRALKDDVDGDLYMSGSGTLVRAMLADGLVDQLHLVVFPTTRGAGPRLFPDTAGASSMELAASDQYDNGVVYLSYRPLA